MLPAACQRNEKNCSILRSAVEHVQDESYSPQHCWTAFEIQLHRAVAEEERSSGKGRKQGDDTNLLGTLGVDVVSHLESGEAGTPCCGTLQTDLYQQWPHNSQAEAPTTKRSVDTTPQCRACTVVLCSLPMPVQNTHRQAEAHAAASQPFTRF